MGPRRSRRLIGGSSQQRSVASHTIMSTDKSSGGANETIASDTDGSGWERLSDLSDHELAKHIMNELSSLLAGLGVPRRKLKPAQQLAKAFKKKKIPKPLRDMIHALIQMRNTLTHLGPARAGLHDRNMFIKLFSEIKVSLLWLAQNVPIHEVKLDGLDDQLLALRLRVEFEAALPPAEYLELLNSAHLQLDSMRGKWTGQLTGMQQLASIVIVLASERLIQKQNKKA